jgi:hypothetical protein
MHRTDLLASSGKTQRQLTRHGGLPDATLPPDDHDFVPNPP